MISTGDHATNIGVLAVERPRALPPVSSVSAAAGLVGLPRVPSAVFVGRQEQMQQLKQVLEAASGVVAQVVVGLGGVGKSELALHYVDDRRGDYDLVWWVDAETPERIQAGLAGLCRALCAGAASDATAQASVEEAAAWAVAWLAARGGWLLVFDNAEDIEHLQPYLGRMRAGQVLITTRRDIGWEQLGAVVRLEVLPHMDAVELLMRTIGPVAAGCDGAQVEELATALGELPLALKQAGAYIAATPGMDVGRYLDLLRAAPHRALSAGAPGRGSAKQVVARTWAVTGARIGETDPLAVRLLRLLAFYAPDRLPCRVLYGLKNTDEIAVAESLGVLASYSMIDRSVDGQLISIHRLVQAVVIAELTLDDRADVRDTAAVLLEGALPDDPTSISTWSTYARLLPHARAVLQPGSPGMGSIITYLRAAGDYRTARSLQEQRCDALSRTLGPEHPDTLTARAHLALITGRAGDPATARDLVAELLPVRARVLGPEHPDTLTAHANLAYFTGETGDPATARDLYTRLLYTHQRLSGPEHSQTLHTHAGVAYSTGEAGDPAGARNLYAQLLPLMERVWGPEHSDTLLARAYLVRFTGQAGEPAAARNLARDLLPVRERTSGTEHPETLKVRGYLARFTGEAGGPEPGRARRDRGA